VEEKKAPEEKIEEIIVSFNRSGKLTESEKKELKEVFGEDNEEIIKVYKRMLSGVEAELENVKKNKMELDKKEKELEESIEFLKEIVNWKE